jgi:Domain of unknown function (DUF4381)
VYAVVAATLIAVVFQTNGPASLLVDAPQVKGEFEIQLADTLKITVIVAGSPTLVVKPPDKVTKSAGWRLVQSTPAALTDQGHAGKRWQQDYFFEPLAPKTLNLQIEPFEISEEKDNYRKIDWKPITVQVHTSIATPDITSLRDPTVIEPLPPQPETEIDPWLSVALSLTLFALAVGAFIWWRRRHRQRPVRARQSALRELDRLVALNLPEKNKTEGFHTLLANIVRRYLEREFQLPARRRTTMEFLEVLQSCQKLPPPPQEFLRDFLVRCDLAKFARVAATPEECAALANQVREFVEAV